MKKLLVIAGIFLSAHTIYSQVGIGTTTPDPSSLLEVSSTDKGILIPQVSLLDVSDTMIDGVNTAATGLLIFNTNASTIGGSGIGYYYFNGTIWERLITSSAMGDDDWYEEGSTTSPDDINDDMFTQGNVSIGTSSVNYKLHLNESNTSATRTLNITSSNATTGTSYSIYNATTYNGSGNVSPFYNLINGTGNGVINGLYTRVENSGNGSKYGLRNEFVGSGSGSVDGVYNLLIGNGSGEQSGVYTQISNSGNSTHYGLRSTLSGSGSGFHYGIYNGLTGNGTGEQRAIYNVISNSGNNSHYGLINVLSGNGTGIHYGVSNQLGGAGDGQIRGVENSIVNSGNGVHFGSFNLLSGAGTGDQFGNYNEISTNGNANHIGTNNYLSGSGSGLHFGLYNTLSGSGTGDQYAMRSIITNSSNGNHFGNYLGLNGTGSGNKYGSYIIMNTGAGGTHYGVYSQALKSGSYAGYFLGNLAVGTSGANIYTFPASRGTVDQIMQTDGAGNLSWIDPSALADTDWITNGPDIERQSGNVYIGDTNGTNNDLYISNRIIDWDNSSYFLEPGSENRMNEIQFDDGSAADPSLYFNGDATTGFYSPATDETAYSINSSEVMRIDNSGNLGLGTPSPSATLDVEGTFKLGTNGNEHSGLYSLRWNFGTTNIAANSSQVLTIAGTTSILNIPQQSAVSVAFESDIGASVIVQHVWMDADAINIRLLNFSGVAVSFPTQTNIVFVWQ